MGVETLLETRGCAPAPDAADRSWTAAARLKPRTPSDRAKVVGVLEGEGAGPQLVGICLDLLDVVARHTGATFDVRTGGTIGLISLREEGSVLTDGVCGFCDDVFEAGGAILAGAGGGRFVYDMRRRFDLFVKLNPLVHYPELDADAPVRWRKGGPIDVMVVRENMGGLYQGCAETSRGEDGIYVEHRFGYSEGEVMRVASVAARIAATRQGHLTVIAKDSGLPDLTRLWFDCARRAAADEGVRLRTMDIDFAAYAFISAPDEFDVIVVPNCFGDIIADLGGVICGSRGSTYGGSYSATGAAVYQTNHGAAYDLAGKDSANPVGQLLSLAMMLHETFGMEGEAEAIVAAIRRTWREGWRTADIMAPGRRLAATSQFARIVGEHLEEALAAA